MKNQMLKLSIACTFLLPSLASAEIKLDAPMSGWRSSEKQSIVFEQEVHYPASVVSSGEGHASAEMIRGSIKGLPKKSKVPGKLIVNGVAMPLRMADGKFSRPYSFGPGSNSVEVRSPSDKKGAYTAKRVQFYEAYKGLTRPELRVVLAWDSDGSDLDLHVVAPDGGHCFYGNRSLPDGSALDIDVTNGYGPEIYASPAPQKGNYLVFVNYYGAGARGDVTTASVSIITHEGTPDEKIETSEVPLRKPGELTLIKSFVY